MQINRQKDFMVGIYGAGMANFAVMVLRELITAIAIAVCGGTAHGMGSFVTAGFP